MLRTECFVQFGNSVLEIDWHPVRMTEEPIKVMDRELMKVLHRQQNAYQLFLLIYLDTAVHH